jgi:hypothetical protein
MIWAYELSSFLLLHCYMDLEIYHRVIQQEILCEKFIKIIFCRYSDSKSREFFLLIRNVSSPR